nr:MAG TPA: hypothetical protein [Caudoviricetes sp.]
MCSSITSILYLRLKNRVIEKLPQILGITMYNIRCIMFLIMCLYVSSYHCNQMVLF